MNISKTALTSLENYFETLDWTQAVGQQTADTEFQEELPLDNGYNVVRISNLVQDEWVTTAWSVYKS